VDGTIEPDRWILDRKTEAILSHHPADRHQAIVEGPSGIELQPLPVDIAARPPLSPREIQSVLKMARTVEKLFGSPQDMEWTISKNALFILQSRPITTGEPAEGDDKRSWYLSLRRSFENLKALLKEVEGKWIPAMIAEGDELSLVVFSVLSDVELADEIDRRQAIHRRWSEVYETYFIPLAHGIRLFGQTYNDALRPVDPYEFMDLLGGTELISVDRNRLLARMAEMVRGNQALELALRAGVFIETDQAFDIVLEEFARRYGDLGCGTDRCFQGNDALIALILRMAAAPAVRERFSHAGIEERREVFLSRFAGDARNRAVEILDLGRASYRLRDNDNIHLGRIEGALLAAIEEGKHRLEGRMGPAVQGLQPDEAAQALRDPDFLPRSVIPAKEENTGTDEITVRQIRGQPAGPGVARGPARVIVVHADLLHIRSGEILVCDAIDPNMTFAVPLAAAIVERRGGMLIHGAIIAREYGIPCVTGVPKAIEIIKTGDRLVVDGYLGIVTIEKSSDL
jgi:rifampicin phosphotransferase